MRLPYDGSFRITQRFGENPASYAKFGLKGHNGLDFGLPTGTPVLAPHAGVIKEAYYDPAGYGWYVKVESETEGSVLAHFLSFNGKIGDKVEEGQLVGLSNNSGNSTGPHLHWGYYKIPRDRSNGFNGYIDQYQVIEPLLGADQPMTIGKKQFEELIAKLDRQEREIARLKDELQACVALKEKECQDKINGLKDSIKKKVIEAIETV